VKGDPPAEIDYLITYYRGVYSATVALKGRLAKLEPEWRDTVREVDRYQTMIKRFRDAMNETKELHASRTGS
jgi:hypothetical protein